MSARRTADLSALEARLGYVFKDRSHLEKALTHMSAASAEARRELTYQRLEFLGDRVLGVCVSDMLFRTFPEADEGELSRRLADLVRKETCAEVAGQWEVGPHLKIGGGEAQTGARKNKAILADVCEGIVGAVFMDGGFEAARGLIERCLAPRMLAPPRPLRDAKTALQEWAQGQGHPTPTYAQRGRSGPDHAPRFMIAAEVPGFPEAVAEGRSKRLAEQAAAEAFLRRESLWEEVMAPTGGAA